MWAWYDHKNFCYFMLEQQQIKYYHRSIVRVSDFGGLTYFIRDLYVCGGHEVRTLTKHSPPPFQHIQLCQDTCDHYLDSLCSIQQYSQAKHLCVQYSSRMQLRKSLPISDRYLSHSHQINCLNVREKPQQCLLFCCGVRPINRRCHLGTLRTKIDQSLSSNAFWW